jgi:hypothetical protein
MRLASFGATEGGLIQRGSGQSAMHARLSFPRPPLASFGAVELASFGAEELASSGAGGFVRRDGFL